MPSMRFSSALCFPLIFVLFILGSVSGCGYHLRGRSNHWQEQGIERLYIAPLVNNTRRAGLEQVILSSLNREFARGGRIQLVRQRKDADGVLLGTIDGIQAQLFSGTTADAVSPRLRPGEPALPGDFLVATEYNAGIQVSVALIKLKATRSTPAGATLWTQSFSRSRLYPASNQGGDIGNTSVLINESRLQSAVLDLSSLIATDVHDVFFEAF